jgi:type IV pilus assembly protein PilF
MHKSGSIYLLFSIYSLSGCSPLSIASMAGQTLVRTAVTLEEQNQVKKEMNHNIAIANYNVGVEYLRQGDNEKALERLSKAQEADPGYVPIYNALGLVYQRLEEPVNAEENFEKAIKLDDTDSDALNNYGQFLCNSGRAAQANEFFMKAASNPLYKTPEIPYTNAGLCAMNNKQQETAAEYFNKALSLNPGVPAALLQMCEISYDKGNYPAARDYLRRYLEGARHTAKSLWLGIRIELELGDKDALSSYALLLRNDFSETEEAELLRVSGIR